MREKLMTLSLAALRDIAKDKNIKGISSMRKNELIDAIIAASEADGTLKQSGKKDLMLTVFLKLCLKDLVLSDARIIFRVRMMYMLRHHRSADSDLRQEI